MVQIGYNLCISGIFGSYQKLPKTTKNYNDFFRAHINKAQNQMNIAPRGSKQGVLGRADAQKKTLLRMKI